MKLIGKQIVMELPEEKPRNYVCPATYGEGYNDALSEVARMNPAWEVDELNTAALIIEAVVGKQLGSAQDIAKALAADPAAWLKRKDVMK